VADGIFKSQIVPVSIPQKRGKPDLVIEEDEEYKRVDFDKFGKLSTVFQVRFRFHFSISLPKSSGNVYKNNIICSSEKEVQ